MRRKRPSVVLLLVLAGVFISILPEHARSSPADASHQAAFPPSFCEELHPIPPYFGGTTICTPWD